VQVPIRIIVRAATEAANSKTPKKDRGDAEREAVTQHEGFFLTILQTVSGAALVAGVAQAELLTKLVGRLTLLLFLSCLALSLVLALAAAYWRHWYRLWGLKASVSSHRKEMAEAAIRVQKANRDLKSMRRAFVASFWLVVVAFALLIAGLWSSFI
jgi:hypothetical protein